MSNVLDLKEVEPGQAALEVQEAADSVEEVASDQSIAQSLAWQAHSALPQSAQYKHYLLLGGVIIAGGAVSLWQSSWLTFVTVLVGAGAWIIRERIVHPVSVAIDDRGVTIDGQHYAHTELTSFDLHRMPDQSVQVSLKTRHWYVPHFRLPLGSQDHEEVRALLSQYVVHERHAVSLLDYWLRS